MAPSGRRLPNRGDPASALRGYPFNAEAAGYMLRGFFEAMRQHIAFERQFIVVPEGQLS